MKAPLLLLTAVQPNADGHLSDAARRQIRATLQRCADVRIDVVIREHEVQRSLDQNAYWHAEVFPKVAEFMGEDIEGAKLILMGECWGWKRCEFTHREIPVKPRTSSMTVKEGTYFTDWVIPWAVEHCEGLQILLPDEWQRSVA